VLRPPSLSEIFYQCESVAWSEVIFDNGGSWPGKDFLYSTVDFYNKLSKECKTMIENYVQGAIRLFLISGSFIIELKK
jgi:hypothetical protein